jgi:hypothetical protein
MTGSSSIGSLLGHTLVPLVLVLTILAFSLVSQQYRLKWGFLLAARVTIGEAATEAVIEMVQHFAVLFFPKLWRSDQGRLDKLRQLKNVLRDTSFTDSKTQNLMSGTAFLLVVLPILVVPFTLHLDKAPSMHDPRRSEAAKQPETMLGIAIKSRSTDPNGGLSRSISSTTGAHEATSLAKSMQIKPAFRMVSSDVCIDSANNRVIVPSRVPSTCTREVVKAFNITVLVASYKCSRWPTGNSTETDVNITLSNITGSGGALGQSIRVVYTDRTVQCDTFYEIQEADVTWHGKGHACKILQDRCVMSTTPRNRAASTYSAERLRTPMTNLDLALQNAYVHLVDYELFAVNSSDFEDFYGVIHAAGAPPPRPACPSSCDVTLALGGLLVHWCRPQLIHQ